MDRRKFVKHNLGLAMGAATSSWTLRRPAAKQNNDKILNAYYFRAHMYTCVPMHIRNDMERMADWGTTHVTIAVLEQDFRAAHHNIDLVCNEAERVGIKMLAVPSRWCGLFAGAPKVPSEFAARFPDTWMKDSKGQPVINSPSGPVCSIHHPRVREYLEQHISQLVTRFPITGIIMDEPKMLNERDFSEYAIRKLGPEASERQHITAKINYFNELGVLLKKSRADASLSLFIPASQRGSHLDHLAAMSSLDYIGCDGRPWNEGKVQNPRWNRKCLFPTNIHIFLEAALKYKKKTLCLVENHDLPMPYLPIFDAGFSDVLKLNLDHLIYYYYPRNIEDPTAQMKVVAKHIQNFR